MTDKTDALVALAEMRDASAKARTAESSKDERVEWDRYDAAERIVREALAEQPAGAVAEVVDLYGTGVKVPAWIGTGPAPDIPVGTKLYVGIPPAASVDDAVGCPTCGAPCSERRIVDGPHSSHYEYTYTPPAASVDASAIMEVVERYAGKTANATKYIRQDLLKLIDSAGGAKVNEPFGNSEQLRQAAAGFLAASFYPDGDGYTDDMRQTYSYWHKRLLAELRPAGVMEYVQAEASARINARREAASR